MNLRAISDEEIIRVVAHSLQHSDQKPVDLLWAANAFVAAHRVCPGGLSIEVGTRSGGSARCWLELIQILYPGPVRPALLTVDPYGRKPYAEYKQDPTMRYGDDHFVEAKRLLAGYPNHAHFLLESRAFFALLPGEKLWSDGGEHDGKNWTIEHELGARTAWIFLDGDHSLEGISADLDLIYPEDSKAMGWRPAATVIDNVVHKDPRVMPWLEKNWDVTVSATGIQALVRGRRQRTA